MDRDVMVRRIAEHVEDLTVRVLVDDRYLWSPRVEGLRHRDKDGRWVEHSGPLPKKEPRRVRRRDPGLVAQLGVHDFDAYATGGSHEPVTGSKPGSRPPLDLGTYDTLERLSQDAHLWRVLLASEAGKEVPKRAPVGADLAAIRGLVLHPAAKEDTIRAVDRGLKAYINEALIGLQYLAPMVRLSHVCGECRGQLLARADATSDPFCIGGTDVLVPWAITGCGTSYVRGTWADLLKDQATG